MFSGRSEGLKGLDLSISVNLNRPNGLETRSGSWSPYETQSVFLSNYLVKWKIVRIKEGEIMSDCFNHALDAYDSILWLSDFLKTNDSMLLRLKTYGGVYEKKSKRM